MKRSIEIQISKQHTQKVGMLFVIFIFLGIHNLKSQNYFTTLSKGFMQTNLIETDSSYVSLINKSFYTNYPNYRNRIQLVHYSKENGVKLFQTTLTYDDTNVYSTELTYNSDIFLANDKILLPGKVIRKSLDTNVLYQHFSTLFEQSKLPTLYDIKKRFVDSSLNSAYTNIIAKTNYSFIVTGDYYLPKPNYLFKTFIREIDTAGNILWEKKYGMPFQCHLIPKSIVKTKDNGFLVVCEEKETYYRIPSSSSSDITNWRITIIKIDSIGNELWRKPIGMPEKYNIKSSNILSTDDSTYYIAWSNNDSLYHDILWGKYRSGPHSNASIYLTKFDYHGNDIWTNKYRKYLKNEELYSFDFFGNTIYHSHYPEKLIFTKDSGLIITGGLAAMKIDYQTGEFIWRRNEIRPMIDSHILFTSEIRSVIETQDGGLIFGGEYIVDNPRLGQHTFIIKADKYGCMKPGCHIQDKWYVDSISKNNPPKEISSELKIYPNPTSDFITIQLPNDYLISPISSTIIDINGKIIKTIIINESTTLVSLNELQSGMYFITFNGLDNDKTYKVIKN